MPRLTDREYLALHHWLRALWLADIGSYADVSEEDRRALHAYFCPDNDRSDEQLLEHRRIVSKRDPSLPQRAGRALLRFKRANAGEGVYTPPVYVMPRYGRQGGHAITIRTVIKPEPDLDGFVRAILLMAEEQTRRDKTRRPSAATRSAGVAARRGRAKPSE